MIRHGGLRALRIISGTKLSTNRLKPCNAQSDDLNLSARTKKQIQYWLNHLLLFFSERYLKCDPRLVL